MSKWVFVFTSVFRLLHGTLPMAAVGTTSDEVRCVVDLKGVRGEAFVPSDLGDRMYERASHSRRDRRQLIVN